MLAFDFRIIQTDVQPESTHFGPLQIVQFFLDFFWHHILRCFDIFGQYMSQPLADTYMSQLSADTYMSQPLADTFG